MEKSDKEKEQRTGMLRGCQKRIYVIRKPESALFEEAYFLLKPTRAGTTAPDEAAMQREAERIVSEVYGFAAEYTQKKKGGGQMGSFGVRFMAFLAGAAVSSAAIGSVALLLTFA